MMNKSMIIIGKINTQKKQIEEQIINSDNKVLIITKNNLITHYQKLMAKNKIKGRCISTSGFSNFFYDYIRKETRTIASREEMIIILSDILTSIDENNLFKKTQQNTDVVDKILDFILEMKENHVYAFDLDSIRDELKGILQTKIGSISEISILFDDRMDELNLISPQEYTWNCTNDIKDIPYDKIVVDVLEEYSPSTLDILKKLISLKKCEFVFSMNDYNDQSSNYYKKILANDRAVRTELEKTLVNNNYTISREFTSDEFIENINDNIFSNKENIVVDNHIFTKENETISEEILNAIEFIKEKLINGINPNDITLSACEIENYFPMIEEHLFLNNIAFNDNRSVKLNSLLLGSDLERIVEVCIKDDLTLTDVITIAKTSFFNEKIDNLTRLYNRFGDNINIATSNASVTWSQKSSYVYNDVVRIINKVIEFKNQFQKEKSVEILSEILNGTIELQNNLNFRNEIFKKIKQYDDEEKKETALLMLNQWNQIVDIIKSIKEMNFKGNNLELFLKVLRTAKLQKPVISKNKINVADIKSAMNGTCKVLLVLGCSDGHLPQKQSIPFITYEERNKLEKFIPNLAIDKENVLLQKHYDVLSLLTTPQEYLYVSFSKHAINGQSLECAPCIKNMFNNEIIKKIHVNEDFYLNTLEKLSEYKFNGILDENLKTNVEILLKDERFASRLSKMIKNINIDKTKINSSNIAETYKKTNGFAVTQIEKYSECPFKHFMYYAMRPKEEKTFEEKASDKGNFYHQVACAFYQYIIDNDLNFADINKTECDSILEPIIVECLDNHNDNILNSHIIHEYTAYKMKRRIKNSIWNSVQQMQQGNWYPNLLEKEVSIDLENGKQLIGKIDRIDTVRVSGVDYGRIIDYKSSIKDVTEDRLLSGLQLQLPLYLKAIKKEVTPAGMYYFPIIDPTTDIDKPDDSILKKYKLNGLTLEDKNILVATDNILQEEKTSSDIISASISAKGEINKRSKVNTEEEFDEMIEKGSKIAEENIENILQGETKINPLKLTDFNACEYCPFSTMCHKDTVKRDFYRKLEKDTESTNV